MRTLLIADDERTIREGISKAIDWEAAGISKVITASDGREAYDLIVKEKPDIAIVDIIMPEKTGIQLISEIKRMRAGTEFVIISGYGEFDYAQEAMRNHVHNYILKPCDLNEISDTIKKIMEELDRRDAEEKERKELEEHISRLVPQAREQLFRDFLAGDGPTPENLQLLGQMLGKERDRLRILVFFIEDMQNYSQLVTLKKCVEEAKGIGGWSFCTILDHDVLRIFEYDKSANLEECVRNICKRAASCRIFGVKAAVSGGGTLEDLPDMYNEAREALRLSLLCGTGEDGPGASPLVDASIPRCSKAIHQVIKYVNENLSDSTLSLSNIASNVLFLNPDYLGKLFKKECGVKFSDYLMAARMEKAKQILRAASDMKIYEIARQIGLGDNSAYFSQVFRKYTGMLPGEYKSRQAL